MTVWDKRFFELVDVVASWSEDTSRKIGAVIVGPSNEIRATGFNGLPRGVCAGDAERHSKEDGEKYYWYEHAERNAIFNAARIGVPLEGCIIYANLFPCADCARAIVQSGLKALKTYTPPESDPTYQRSFLVSKALLEEGGVELVYFDSDG